ncbi:signal peptidase II [Anaeromusa acidaminophila]|uniref:signal peptidase II n=1 Tax=Anaeromusa acidaminophila TaxID=81464 RepID=UPI00058513B0|nr:signal peptidase II [Anaeromusa acidaminophila]
MFVWGVALAIADQLLKKIFSGTMQLGESIPVLPGIFHLTYIQNPGAAFGLFENQTLFFIVIAAFLLAFLAFAYKELAAQGIWVRFGMSLLAGGAVGNLLDRVRFGAVIDYLDFRIWPIFNLADIGICLGAALIVWGLLREEGRETSE